MFLDCSFLSVMSNLKLKDVTNIRPGRTFEGILVYQQTSGIKYYQGIC